MKVILSRKGFDSSYGKMPSPIICTQDGRKIPISLPIPYFKERSDLQFSNIQIFENVTVEDFLLQMKPNFYEKCSGFCHLDPDLRHDALSSRPKNWNKGFGQVDIAQFILSKQNVCKGDLFLFFWLVSIC